MKEKRKEYGFSLFDLLVSRDLPDFGKLHEWVQAQVDRLFVCSPCQRGRNEVDLCSPVAWVQCLIADI